jgi:hypothetical protein
VQSTTTTENPNLFRIHVDVILGDMKHKLTQLNGRLHSRDQRRVRDVEYRRLSVCSDVIVLFTKMKLKNDGGVRTMFSLFAQYMLIDRSISTLSWLDQLKIYVQT